jgi:hypothetical protein
VAARNLVGKLIAGHLLDHGLTPEQFGAKVGLSGVTVRRIIDPEVYGATIGKHHVSTKIAIARELREDPSTLWPPITNRKKAAA